MTDNATKSTLFESEPDILVIHLRLFVYDALTNETKKILPNIQIWRNWSIQLIALQGIVCHEGNLANTGHYTCCVKVNDNWFSINDQFVNDGKNAHLRPYLLFDKKIKTKNVSLCHASVTKSPAYAHHANNLFLLIWIKPHRNVPNAIWNNQFLIT